MSHRFFLFCTLLIINFATIAEDRYLIKFELLKDNKKIEWGSTFVSQKQGTWRKGYKRSYLKMDCIELPSGKTEAHMGSIDHFEGLLITHQVNKQSIDLSVDRNVVTPRLKEIRALAKNDCQNLSPIVNQHQQNYAIQALHGSSEEFTFGENLKFHVTVQSMRKIQQ